MRRIALAALLSFAALGWASAPPRPSGDLSWAPLVEPADATVPEPPDGRWLLDEAGREYTVFRWTKHEGYYVVDAAARSVRLHHGVEFRLEHEDAEFLYLRWYRVAALRQELRARAERQLAEASARRAAYRTSLGEVDILRLVAWDEGLPRAGQWRNRFAVADFDRDGHLDIAHGPPRKGPTALPVIFLGDGAGRWRPWTKARFPAWPYDYGGAAAGDLDGDGHTDLVLTAHVRGLIALRGDGAGSFTPWTAGLPERESNPPGARPFTSRAVALADWNGDGRLDVLALSEGPASGREGRAGAGPSGKRVYLNRGDGTWRESAAPGAHLGDTILPADLDADGRVDFVTDSRAVGSAQLLNFGQADGSWRVAELPEARPHLRVYAIAAADFDGDGRLDLAVSFQSREAGTVWHGVDLYLQAVGAESGWRRRSLWASDAGWRVAPTALDGGDFDGDGDADLVVLNFEGAAWILLNEGDGEFVRESGSEAEPDDAHRFCRGYAARAIDLDGDRRPEIVAAFAGEPGGEMFHPESGKHCAAEGQLRVWKVLASAREGAR